MKEQFLKDITCWNNHLPLLWLALEETKTGSVMEMGCGQGSTRQLHEYCTENSRMLYSFENDPNYLNEFYQLQSPFHRFIKIVDNKWDVAYEIYTNPSVILIDHSPGERRIVDVERFADCGGILVLHDTEPPPTAANFGWEKIWHLFKYNVQLDAGRGEDGQHNRPQASAVSNVYDVTKWKGLTFNNGEYILK